MLSITVAISAVLVWFYIAACCMMYFENGGAADLRAWGCLGVLVLSLAWAIDLAIEHEAQYPCVTYESRLTYNAATKSMMPLRVRVERGEWEE